jgi:hypothetical protein
MCQSYGLGDQNFVPHVLRVVHGMKEDSGVMRIEAMDVDL